MVQELQHQPEDFFNLSTLAEVTLIAGKLSTTDINEIKNYISKAEDGHVAHPEGGNKILLYREGKRSYESTKKKWKNNWENFKGQKTIHALENSPSSVSSKSYAFLSSSCSSVSSDDDSTKSLLSYSHKVFDRKKQRSFKQSSTESEYEFHYENRERHYDAIKDLSCDSNSNEMGKGDEISSDKGEMAYRNNSDESFDGKNDEALMSDHICPECGKKYSTSECEKCRRVSDDLTFPFPFISFQAQTLPDTDKLIDHCKTRRHVAVLFVIRFTCQCPPFQCTCGRTTRTVSVRIVGNPSHGRGCFRDTLERIQVG